MTLPKKLKADDSETARVYRANKKNKKQTTLKRPKFARPIKKNKKQTTLKRALHPQTFSFRVCPANKKIKSRRL